MRSDGNTPARTKTPTKITFEISSNAVPPVENHNKKYAPLRKRSIEIATLLSVDAVGTIITDRPPHRSVRALLRIRLPPWMSGEKTNYRIRMQNTWSWQPLREDREEPIPRGASLTAAAENEPPQSPHSLPEDTQPVDVSRDRMVAVIAVHNLSQPCTDGSEPPKLDQSCFLRM